MVYFEFAGHFLENCFYCYSRQIISVEANESLIPYELIKGESKTQNPEYCNSKSRPKPNKKNTKYSSVFRTKDFVPHKHK